MNPPPFKVLQPAATDGVIEKLIEEIGILPSSYVEFLRASNGAECGPNDEPGDSLRMLAASEVKSFGASYGVSEYLPDLTCFASDGGDHAFAFQRHGAPDDWPIVRIPLGALLRSEILTVSK